MHSRTWLAAAALLVTLLAALAGCAPVPMSGPPGRDAAPVPRDVVSERPVDAGPARYVSIEINPAETNVAVGGFTRFTATATLSDTTTEDVTTRAEWSSSDATKATINAIGEATGVALGTTLISATIDGRVSGTATLTVAAPQLVSIELSPGTLTLGPGGAPEQITAHGRFSDRMTRVLNDEPGLRWQTSNPMVATVDARGRATAVGPGTARVTATLDGVTSGSPAIVTVCSDCAPNPRVTIALDPPSTTLSIGETARFTVTMTFADGRTGDITAMCMFSVDNANATVGTGADSSLVTARAPGVVTLTATVGGLTGTAALTIRPTRVRSLAIEPVELTLPATLTRQLRVVATFDEGSARELTTTNVRWTSDAPATASISPTGLVTALAPSPTPVTFTATYRPEGGAPIATTATTLVTGSAPRALTVTLVPPEPLGIGGRAQLRVEALFDDERTYDVTVASRTGFRSSAGATAAVSATGQVTGVSAGNATITASYAGLTAAIPVTVALTLVTAVELTPASLTLPLSTTARLAATARLSDGRTRDVTEDPNLTFESSDPAVARVTNAAGTSRGALTPLRPGTTQLTARYTPPMGMGMPVTSAPTPLTVTDARVVSLAVAPVGLSLPVGSTARFTAIARYSDATTRDISDDPHLAWSSSSPSVATLSNLAPTRGLARARAVGTAHVSATYVSPLAGAAPLSTTTGLTVTAP